MTYQQQTEIATDHRFVKKVQQAALDAAIEISSEASSGNPVLDAARRNFATRLIHDPQTNARILAYSVVTDARIDGSYADGVIKTVVLDQWNANAGHNPAQA